ncbi:MAG: LysR family transcriptional regulator [Desulfovibrio sp.]|nr:LysR family transcriptional regulator [Desulfovibrio sp.]
MELRVLRYFLAVAREESISGAAHVMFVTQPTLSRQMSDLEEELGKKLFHRGKRRITLTEEGIYLRRRAEEILALVKKTESAFKSSEEEIRGDVFIGGAETDAVRLIARATKRLREQHPHIVFHIQSGNAEDIRERLDKGLIDFGVLIEPADLQPYSFIRMPVKDTWGVLTRKDGSLASRPAIHPGDLAGLPLIISRTALLRNELAGWMGELFDDLNVIMTYNLLNNAALMAEEGLGHVLCLDRIVRTSGESPLCFIPLEPAMKVGVTVVWQKHQIFSKAASKFLECLKEEIHGKE